MFMLKVKTPDEILEEQRADSAKAYADKVSALQLKANDLQHKCDNLQAIIEIAVSNKIQQLNDLELKLRDKFSDAEIKEHQAQLLMKEAVSRMELSNKYADQLRADRTHHDEQVRMHVESSTQEKESIERRHAICNEKEEEAEKIVASAHQSVKEALDKSKTAKDLIEQYNGITKQAEEAIARQQEIEKRNVETLKSISNQREELEKLRNELSEKYKVAVDKENEVESNRVILTKRKSDLDERENHLKQMSIKNSLDIKRIQDRQQEIDFNTGKLNELKNNVEALVKAQEKGV